MAAPQSLFFSTSRSVRLLFVVPPEALVAAIAESSALWGGMYNPIVTDVSNVEHALRLYRPEYIVVFAALRDHVLALDLVPKHFVRTFEDEFPSADEPPHISIAMASAVADIYEAEFKFARRFDVQRVLPIAPDSPMKAYWMARLGAFTEPPTSWRVGVFRRAFSALLQPQELRPTHYVPFDDRSVLCPMALNTFYLMVGSAPTTLVVLDPENVEHVVCFWNIRSLGWKTIALSFENLATATRETIDEYPISAATQVVVLGAASNDQGAQIARLANGSPIRDLSADNFWEWTTRGDVYTPVTPDHLQEQSSPVGELFALRMQAPQFLVGPRSGRRVIDATWVNTVRRGSSGPLLTGSFNGLTLRDSRLFGTHHDVNPLTNEVAVVGTGASDTVHIRWPTCFQYVEARLSTVGFKVTRAPLANVIDAALDVHGVENLRLLAHPSVAELWLRAGNGDVVERWREACMSATERRRDVADRWLTHLVQCGLLARGAFVRCSSCLQSGWVSLADMGPTFPCEMCSRESEFPQIAHGAVAWAYRRSGPLAQSTHARSCVSIALAMRYLAEMRRGNATWTGPVKVAKGGVDLEVDGVIEFPTMIMGQHRWAFLEAKSRNALEETDFARLRQLADSVPTCACVVATLRAEYSATEKAELQALAQHVQSQGGLVLALTAAEILTRSEWTVFPPHGLEKAAAEFRKHIV